MGQQKQSPQKEEKPTGNEPSYYQQNIQLVNITNIDQKEAMGVFLSKILSPFTSIDDLRAIFMNPIPPLVG